MLDDKGIQVSDNWQPGDRAGFNLAVAKRVQGHASGAYGTELFKHIQGDWIKPGLSRQGFFADPAIQQRWRSALYLPDSLSLKPDWSLDAYEQAIYRPTLRLDAQQLLEERLVEPARYGERNDKADIGRDSYRALIVPMIALLFSLLGAFTHLFKCTLFALRAVRPVPRRAYWGALAVRGGGAGAADAVQQQGHRTAAVSHPQAARRQHPGRHGLGDRPRCAVDRPGAAAVLPAQRSDTPAPAARPELRLPRQRLMTAPRHGLKGAPP
ncbi:hypothetical protein NWF32_29760 [Pseudomonas qingdaonensis]|nr:hypothetical protein [Pseudomonas qingdaonensis]